MEIEEYHPFPHNVLESDIEKARSVNTLTTGRTINGDGEKKLTECWDTAWSSDAKLFAWSCGRRKVMVVRVDKMESDMGANDWLTIDCRQTVTALEFVNMEGYVPTESYSYRTLRCEEHGQVLAVGLRNGRVRVYDVNTGSILLELLDHTDQVSGLDFVPNADLTLVSSSFDGTIKFWELADDGNMALSFRVGGAKHRITSVASSPDAKRVAAVGTFKMVVIYDLVNRCRLRDLMGHRNHVNNCSFSPDGVLLIACSVDTTALIWNSHTGDILSKLGHQFPPPRDWCPGENDTNVLSCKFGSGGLEAVTVSDDGYIRFWDLSHPGTPSSVCTVDGPLCCSFNPGGDLLAVGNADGDVEIIQNRSQTFSLAHICRLSVNNCSNIGFARVDQLLIPTSLKRFLKYEHIEM